MVQELKDSDKDNRQIVDILEINDGLKIYDASALDYSARQKVGISMFLLPIVRPTLLLPSFENRISNFRGLTKFVLEPLSNATSDLF